MNEDADPDCEKDVKNLSLINQGTLRMSHVKVCSKISWSCKAMKH